MYTLEDGQILVKLARDTITEYLKNGEVLKHPENLPETLKERAGVFVTLHTYPDGDLRGCIGYPEPIMPLLDATTKASISAATGDPRFSSVKSEELDNIIIEVTILTPPELIRVEKPAMYPEMIEIGRDGLIVEKGMNRGLLLPQVPIEQGWNKEEFLSGTCMKAGLMPDSWLEEITKIYKFEGKIYSETKPKNEIIEKTIRQC